MPYFASTKDNRSRMTDNQKKHYIEKVASGERTSTSLDQAPDSAQHRNASVNDVAEAEKKRTTKSSGSFKEDSMSSVEITIVGVSANRHTKLTEADLLVHEKLNRNNDERETARTDIPKLASGAFRHSSESQEKKHKVHEMSQSEQQLTALASNDPRYEPVLNLREHANTLPPGAQKEKMLALAKEQTEELSGENPASQERLAAMRRAVEQILHTAKDRFGAQSIDAMHVDKDDVGAALSALLFGPEACKSMGPEEARRVGQRLFVFVIAPVFGAGDEAQKQFSKENLDATVQKGGTNFLIGTGIGVILERCHPLILLGATGIAATSFFNEQFNAPEYRARNEELVDISAKIDGASNRDLLNFADKTKRSLGPDVFNGTFSVATGGIGLPGGAKAGQIIKEETGHAVARVDVKSIIASLGNLKADFWHAMSEMCGPRWAAEGPYGPPSMKMSKFEPEPVRPTAHSGGSHHSDSLAEVPKQSHGDDWLRSENKLPSPLQPAGDFFCNSKKHPEKYKIALSKGEASERAKQTLKEVAERTLTDVQKQFLKIMDIPVLPVRAIEDICRTSPVPDMMKKMKACYDPNERVIYVAEFVEQLGKPAKSVDNEFDIQHEFGHALNWLLKKGTNLMEGTKFGDIFKSEFEVMLKSMSRGEAKNRGWLNDFADDAISEAKARNEDWLHSEDPIPEKVLKNWKSIADEVFADGFASASGYEPVGNAQSQWNIANFPKCVEYVKRQRPIWLKAIENLKGTVEKK